MRTVLSPAHRAPLVLGLATALALLGCVDRPPLQRKPTSVPQRFREPWDGSREAGEAPPGQAGPAEAGGDAAAPAGAAGPPAPADPSSEAHGSPDSPLSAPRVVARFELAAPEGSPFVLHGTLPVPKGAFPRGGAGMRLGVVNPGREREARAAQVEIVSRDPRGDADVVELLVRVDVPPTAQPRSYVRYDVVALEGEPETAPPGPAVPERVVQLLDPEDHAPLRVRAEDVFGNVYAADLKVSAQAPGFGSARVQKAGVAARQRRLHATLVPVSRSGHGDPLPHMMGVHAYVTEWAGDARVSLDLRIHNGSISPHPEPDPLETPAGILYWRKLELVVPPGWTVVPLVADPFFREARETRRERVFQLVRPNADRSLHLMGPQAQFERRLVLVPTDAAQPTRLPPDIEGLAFAVPGAGLWSWTSPETARYFPQRSLLASWDAFRRGGRVGEAGLRSHLRERYEALRRLLEAGAENGADVVAEAMGWCHPRFYRYGGATGGGDIHFYAGHEAAAVASWAGYALLALEHRMNVARQSEAAYDRAGDPVGYHAWLADGRVGVDFRTHGGMVPDALKLPAHGGPPPSEHVLEVHRRGLRPAYDRGDPHVPGGEIPPADDNLLSWSPHDGQHKVRYTKDAKALVWLGNDALARDDLLLSAELFHLMFHESEGPAGAGGLLALEREVAARPHRGAWVGREAAWGLDAACAAYSVGSLDWRARNYEWLARCARALVAAALPNGIVQRIENEKVLGHAEYAVTQTFETMFLLHAVRCLDQSVLRGVDAELVAALEELTLRAVEYVFFGPVWTQASDADGRTSGAGPSAAFAVAPAGDPDAPPFCDAARWGEGYLPQDGRTEALEMFHGWAILEYAMPISPQQGKGLANRYLARTLRLGNPARDYAQLLNRLFAGTAKSSTDNSANWVGLAGRVQALLDER